jgi:hypothetical protein
MNSTKPPIQSFLDAAFQPHVVRRAFVMSIVVGLILISINHGMCIVKGKFGGLCLLQSALTFFVPYGVSTVASVMAMKDVEQ